MMNAWYMPSKLMSMYLLLVPLTLKNAASLVRKVPSQVTSAVPTTVLPPESDPIASQEGIAPVVGGGLDPAWLTEKGAKVTFAVSPAVTAADGKPRPRSLPSGV